MTDDYEFYNLKTDPDTKLNLWFLDADQMIDQGPRIAEIRRTVPQLKDDLFNCKGESCKPEITYLPVSKSNKRENTKNRRPKNEFDEPKNRRSKLSRRKRK